MLTITMESATAAMFLSVGISSVLISVQSFGPVIPDIPYGLALFLTSVTTIVSGITTVSSKRALVNSLLFLLATLWMSNGITSTWHGINERYNITSSTDDEKYLLPGYCTSVIVVLLLLVVSIYNKSHRYVAIICAICIVSFIFEIISVWVSLQGFGSVYVLLVLFLAYFWLSNSLDGINGHNSITPMDASKRKENQPKSHDYHAILFTTNAISFAVFFVHVIILSEETKYAFAWPASTGIVQLILGTSALRRHAIGDGIHIMLHGLVWSAVGCTLWLEIFKEQEFPLQISVCVILMLFFITLTIVNIKLELIRAVSCLVMSLFILSVCVDGYHGIFVGVVSCFGVVVSLYAVFAHLTYIAGFHFQLPLGTLIFENKMFKNCTSSVNCCISKVKPLRAKGVFSAEVMLGYAKYVDIQCLGFLVNAIAAFSLIHNSSGYYVGSLPYCIGFGGLIQFVVGFVAFSRGMSFESCSFLIYASFWSIWGTLWILDLGDSLKNVENMSGAISFLIIAITLLGLSTTVNIVWVCINCCFSLLVLSFVIEGVSGKSTEIFQIVIATIFAIVLLYAFLSSYLKNVYGKDILPIGKPMSTISLLSHGVDKVCLADSRRATGVRQIANLMNSGRICGLPTDTVYILAAACNQPKAVERAYKTKKLAEDRPMSVWLSNLSQIQAAKDEFGPVLWDFLIEIWPSNISAVVKRGEWINCLGLGGSGKYIGKPDSIAIRIPDSSITCHLIDQTGPIAVTSANPTGEADTTHHWQVIAKLGDKNCDGVLCDGPSPENAASTVVNCQNIKNRKLGFFRIGLTPKSVVEEIFEKVLKKHNVHTDSISDSGVSTTTNEDLSINGTHNKAFVTDETKVDK